VRKITLSHIKLLARVPHQVEVDEGGRFEPAWTTSLIVYGSGISDGNVPRMNQLPTLLAGRGGNSVKPGRHIIYQRETPICICSQPCSNMRASGRRTCRRLDRLLPGLSLS